MKSSSDKQNIKELIIQKVYIEKGNTQKVIDAIDNLDKIEECTNVANFVHEEIKKYCEAISNPEEYLDEDTMEEKIEKYKLLLPKIVLIAHKAYDKAIEIEDQISNYKQKYFFLHSIASYISDLEESEFGYLLSEANNKAKECSLQIQNISQKFIQQTFVNTQNLNSDIAKLLNKDYDTDGEQSYADNEQSYVDSEKKSMGDEDISFE